MITGSITVGYSKVPQEYVVSLPWTSEAVELRIRPEGYQVCGGSDPIIWPVRIVPCGFHLIVESTTNTCTIEWEAWRGHRHREESLPLMAPPPEPVEQVEVAPIAPEPEPEPVQVIPEPEVRPIEAQVQVRVRVNGGDWTEFARAYQELRKG